jgi:diguanylate cyclase (GGDEF)-like protein
MSIPFRQVMGTKINRTVYIFRRFSDFFLPGGLVFVAALVCVHQGYAAPWLPQIEKAAPYFVLGIGFLLSWRFHRSRLAFVILILILADRFLYYFGPGGAAGFGNEKEVLAVAAILLPVNLGLFYLARERGMFNLRGLVKLLFILAQPLTVYFLFRENPEIFDYLHHRVIDLALLDRFRLPQAALFAYGTILLIFFTGSLFFNKPVLRGFFWSLPTIGAALHASATGSGATLYFSTAGLIIILAVLETAYSMAYHDELTGLPARRSLNATMHSLGRNYTIAMLDIDFFKKFNDKYGHDVGDQVLCMVASHIHRVGGGGRAFRFGGEEFTVVFPGKSKEDALPHLEALRQSIAGARFGLRGKKRPKKTPKKRLKSRNPATVSVTISIGAAEPGRNLSKPDEVIKAADQALYRAKKKGRNCVV